MAATAISFAFAPASMVIALFVSDTIWTPWHIWKLIWKNRAECMRLNSEIKKLNASIQAAEAARKLSTYVDSEMLLSSLKALKKHSDKIYSEIQALGRTIEGGHDAHHVVMKLREELALLPQIKALPEATENGRYEDTQDITSHTAVIQLHQALEKVAQEAGIRIRPHRGFLWGKRVVIIGALSAIGYHALNLMGMWPF